MWQTTATMREFTQAFVWYFFMIKAVLLKTGLAIPNTEEGVQTNQISNGYVYFNNTWPEESDGVAGENILTTSNEDCNFTRTFPCLCNRIGGGLVVNCSHRNLASVPGNIPKETTVLVLSYNKFRVISTDSFRNLVHLKTLDLSNNYLTQLNNGTFTGLHQLTDLMLNENRFNFSRHSFADDAFAPLASLKRLNLKSSFRTGDPEFQYPDIALSKLPNLETLVINGFSNKTFGPGVRKMTSLVRLDLSHTPSFISISKDAFINFKNIRVQILNLNHCNLRWIHPEAFINLPNIDTIDYSYNEELEIRGVGASAYGLQNSTIRKIVMERVHAPPSLTIITEEDVQYLTHTKLEELHMNHNSIGQLMGIKPILALPLSLKVMRVAWNNIQTFQLQILYLLRLRNIEQADGSYQEVYGTGQKRYKGMSFGPSADPPYPNIGPFWDMQNNTFDDHPSVVFQNTKVRSSFTGDHFFSFNLPPKLWMLNSSHTYKIRYTIPAIQLINCSLKYVNFAHNQLNKWMGPIRGAESIRHLDLTGNDCDTVSEYFFSYMTGMETLLIGKNKFGKNFQSEKTFYNLTALKRLDMDDNQLDVVGFNLFSRMSNLTVLQLSQNYLSHFNVNVSGLYKLQLLNLSHNKLRTLTQSVCQGLDHIQKFSSVQVDIRDNPFQCVCDTEYFIDWLTTTAVRFRNLSDTTCKLSNGTMVSLSTNKVILDHLKRQCRSYSVLIGVLCACLSLILVVICVKIIHRQRWKLRYLLYMATNWRQRTGYQRLDTTVESPYGYDVFVSYEDSDRSFIREKVIPRLETEAGLKLCVDKRDFVPGLYITDNILHAIQNSRKTVVFLSKTFVKSTWCMYELNMARMEEIYTGRRLLLVVLKEEIPTSQLSAEIIDIIHKQTYIEMTNDAYGEALFWERLGSALQSEN